jgi:hypothetical protein
LEAFNKDYANYDFSNKLGGFYFGSKDKFPLLQTADFLVYEMNKWIDNALHIGKPVRPQIEMLIKARRRINAIHYQYYDEERLAELVLSLERDRSRVTAGKPMWEPWWPASWHKNS